MLSSVLIPLNYNEVSKMDNQNIDVLSNANILKITSVIFIVGVFWATYEVVYHKIYNLGQVLSELDNLSLPDSFSTSISSTLILPLTILFTIIWSYYYSSQFVKLAIGLFLAVASFGLILIIPSNPSTYHLFVFLFSLFLLEVSDMFISPVAVSILTKYANPKYLAIFASLAYLPSRGFMVIVTLISTDYYSNPDLALSISTILILFLTIGLTYFILKNKSLRE